MTAVKEKTDMEVDALFADYQRKINSLRTSKTLCEKAMVEIAEATVEAKTLIGLQVQITAIIKKYRGMYERKGV